MTTQNVEVQSDGINLKILGDIFFEGIKFLTLSKGRKPTPGRNVHRKGEGVFLPCPQLGVWIPDLYTSFVS
jgi:hypothetical protein